MTAFGSVHDVFHSTAFQLAVYLALFFAAVFWLGFAYWVFRDARRRVDDSWLVGTATLLGLVPIVGPLVYLLFRPPETLDDVHGRRIEIQALESRLDRQALSCPVCRAAVEPAFLICPVCTTQLKEPCATCAAPLERLWQACPYCAAPVGSAGDLDAALSAEAAAQAGGASKPKRARSARVG